MRKASKGVENLNLKKKVKTNKKCIGGPNNKTGSRWTMYVYLVQNPSLVNGPSG